MAKGLFLEKPSPLSFAKAIKNEAELDGMREAHLRDAVALAETLHHLEQEVSIMLSYIVHLMPGTADRIRVSGIVQMTSTVTASLCNYMLGILTCQLSWRLCQE